MDRYQGELSAAMAASPRFEAILPSAPQRGAGVGDQRLIARLGRTWSRYVAYPRAAARVQADVFHVTDHSYGHLVRKLPHDRCVATCHDLMPLRTGPPFEVSRATETRFRWSAASLRRAAHVVCVSEATRRELVELLDVDRERTSVIPNGISPRFRPLGAEQRVAARSSLGTGERFLMHVGSGAPYKNVEGTLSVLAALRAQGTDAILVRVGAHLTPAQREAARRLGVEAAIRDLGGLGEEELVATYNAVDAFLFPSHWEGFGWPALEALACGTPTVVSDCAPLLETTAGAALAAPATDSEALAARVLELWSSEGVRAALRERGRRRAEELAWPAVAGAYARVYAALASGSPVPR